MDEATQRVPLVRGLAALAVVSAFLGALWWLLLPRLLAHYEGFYGNWRDPFLTVRLTNAPRFFALLAAVAAGAALLVPVARRADRRWDAGGDDGRPLLLAGLVAVALLVGLPLSLGEWQAYGLPCWDGYCERAAMWAVWFGEPSAAGLEGLFDATGLLSTGSSLLPPAAIGALAAAGLSIPAAFMTVNLLAWLGVGLLVAVLGLRHLGLSPAAVAVALLLVFAHAATQRSLLFLQTDPVALVFVLLALHALLSWWRRPAAGTAAALFAALLAGLFAKLSFAPVLAAAPLAVLLGDGRNGDGTLRRRLGGAWVAGLAFSLAPAAVWVAFLHATGLLDSLLFDFGFVAGRHVESANFYADNNPLRFAVVALVTFQLAPLLPVSRRFRQALRRDPVRRLLAALVVLFVLSLVALRAAFWPRYFLPAVPLAALLAAAPLVKAVPGRWTRALLGTTYLAANAIFLACGLYY